MSNQCVGVHRMQGRMNAPRIPDPAMRKGDRASAPNVAPETDPTTLPDSPDKPLPPADDPFLPPRPDQEPGPVCPPDPNRRHETCHVFWPD